LHYNNNNIIDINNSSTITVGKYNRNNNPNAPIPQHIEPTNFQNHPINPTKALFKGTPWHLRPKTIKQIAMATTNMYENLEDDDLDEYGDYTKP